MYFELEDGMDYGEQAMEAFLEKEGADFIGARCFVGFELIDDFNYIFLFYY